MAVDQLTSDSAVYQCKSCERHLAANEFYASNQSRCKECVKASVRENRQENADYYRAYDRKRYRDNPERKENAKRCAATPSGVASRKRSIERMKASNPEKYYARNVIKAALRNGKIQRKPCFFCASDKNLQAHHEDYDHPLDVVWLCASCHGKYHAIKGDFRRAKAQQETAP
jgi:hypothetical protein